MSIQNIFIIASDPFHLEMARQVRHADQYAFHGLLDYDEVINPESYPFDDLLAKAEKQLREFSGTVDGIIVHWDFPASTLAPILCEKFGLRSASLEAVLKCEHKYWARLQQEEAIPEFNTGFDTVDPFDDKALENLKLDYPFWLKPIKSYASHLGFRIDSDADFQHAIPIIRKYIPRLGDGFNAVLAHAELPPEIAEVDGYHCIAEEIIKGRQCGVEGYVQNGQVVVHGVIDGVKDARNLSFTRWEYPSVWPQQVRERMVEATRKLMRHLEFNDSPFGVEFFWDEENDRLGVLEVNTRISQSHSDQFIKVEGASNHQIAIDVALGREPDFFHNEGPYSCAAKFMLRRYAEVTVTRVPSKDQIAAIEKQYPDSRIVILVEADKHLGTLRDQDSYSFEIAYIFLGADNQTQLLETYREVANKLDFEFSDNQPVEDWQFAKVKY